MHRSGRRKLVRELNILRRVRLFRKVDAQVKHLLDEKGQAQIQERSKYYGLKDGASSESESSVSDVTGGEISAVSRSKAGKIAPQESSYASNTSNTAFNTSNSIQMISEDV